MGEMRDLEDLYAMSVVKVSPERLREMVKQRARNGVLAQDDVSWLIEHSGWSRAQLFKVAKETKPPEPEFGADATFLDRIAKNGTAGMVFDDLALGMYAAHRCNMKRFREDVMAHSDAEGLDLDMPSLPQLSRVFRDTVPVQVRDGMKNGHKNRYKTTLRMRWEPEYFGQYAQMDEIILDLACLAPAATNESDFVDANGNTLGRVKVMVGDRKRWMVPVKPRLLLIQESKSRMIVAWALLTRPPTADDTLALLADALERRRPENGADGWIGGGLDTLVTDQAGCFRAAVVGLAMAAAGGVLDLNVGYSPVGKAKEERLGGTIQAKLTSGMVGLLSSMESVSGRDMLGVPAHKLLPFGMVVERLRRTIYEYNYETVHSTLRSTPFEAFAAGCPNPRVVPDEVIGSMMLPGSRKASRKAHGDGLHVFDRRGFLAPELARPDIFEKDVEIRVFHHRQDRVAVYKPLDRRVDPDAAEFVALAYDYSHYDERKRKVTMQIWQEGMATIDDAAATANRLRELSTQIGDPLNVNLTAAAMADRERQAAIDDSLDGGEPAGTDGASEADLTADSAPVDPPRRPTTTSRGKNGPQEDRSPAAPDADEPDELDALEAALEHSLGGIDHPEDRADS